MKQREFAFKVTFSQLSPSLLLKLLKRAVSRNSAKLGNYQMPVKLREHENNRLKL